MKIGTLGIVVNESGQVLLIRRDDTRTFAPPGGSLEAGELPTDSVAREVREETGLIVLPVRLVNVYFWPIKPAGVLSFAFRCLQRGGELATSPESPQVGFYRSQSLPGPMAAWHRDRLRHALTHAAEPPFWGDYRLPLSMRLGLLVLTRVIYPARDFRRRWRGEQAPLFKPPWEATAVIITRDQAGRVLWWQQGDTWRLPGGMGRPLEAPWNTAVRHAHAQTGQIIPLANLVTVYTHPERPQMTLAFTAQRSTTPATTTTNAYFAPGDEPANALTTHKTAVLDAISPGDKTTIFRSPPSADGH